jgi:hypothetical protein
MPTIEDPVDDLWQGQWLTARTLEECDGARCRYTFEPLAADEHQCAANLLGVRYRRTLKLRVSARGGEPGGPLEVFTESREAPLAVHIHFDATAQIDRVEVYNGRQQSLSPVRDGADLSLVVSQPFPPGSNDITVVTVRARPHTFSLSTADLETGPVRIRDFGVTITADGRSARHPGQPRIREMIPREPEQTFERAARELAAGTPRRWLAVPEGICVEQAATHFGPVSYTMKPGAEARTIDAAVELPSRNPAATAWLVVRAPEGRIRGATVDGRPARIDAEREAIELPTTGTPLRVLARY